MREKKITRATLKSFIRKNQGRLFLCVRSQYDAMTDGRESVNGGFVPAVPTDRWMTNSLGITGVWMVGNSRDYFSIHSDDEMEGISVSNCCGSFILAVRKI